MRSGQKKICLASTVLSSCKCWEKGRNGPEIKNRIALVKCTHSFFFFFVSFFFPVLFSTTCQCQLVTIVRDHHLPLVKSSLRQLAGKRQAASFDCLYVLTTYLQRFQADVWLNELYSGQAVPAHDRSDMTLQAVLELQKKSDMANRVMKTVLDIHRTISEDNTRQATLWQEKLEALEISKASLSVQGARSLEALSALATQLGLEDTATSR